MKKLLITFCVSATILSACEEKKTTELTNETKEISAEVGTSTIEFETTDHDFGNLQQGEKVSFTYRFKNTGNKNVILTSVKPSCGCTVPKWPKTPIIPGESGEIEVIFDSNGRSGLQQKRITVKANTEPSVHMLQFVANVSKEEQE